MEVIKKIMEKTIKRYWPVFLIPTMAAFVIGFIVPFAEGIYLSFCKFTTIRDAEFVGLQNYIDAFKDATFPDAFKFTTLFAIVTLVLINVLAFLVALALTQKIKGTNIFRTIFFMPNLIGGIVLGYVWQLIFDAIFSKFDTALKLNEVLGFWGLVILVCWQQIGYMMIVYIAGLQAIPEDIQEAAMIDGANRTQRLFRVTICSTLRGSQAPHLAVQAVVRVPKYASLLFHGNLGHLRPARCWLRNINK